jgi:hypothetical protein
MVHLLHQGASVTMSSIGNSDISYIYDNERSSSRTYSHRSLIVYYSKNRVNSNILFSNCQGGFTHDNIMMDFH